MADTYQWTTPGSGTFDVASNWTDETNPGNDAFPGAQDTANLIGPGSGTAQTISGPGDVATLNASGLSILTGAVTTGLTRVDSLTTPSNLDILGSFSATLGAIVGDAGNGSITVGTGGTLTASSSDGTNQAVIGSAADSSGTITVAAGGALLLDGPVTTTNYGLVVGNSGTGSLIVSGAGATVDDLNQDGVTVGYGSGSVGSLVVSNGGTATFGTTNSDDLSAVSVGRSGDGTITVDGAGSELSANGLVYMGRGGDGSLIVADSGVFAQTNAAEGLEIGDGSSISNSHVGGTGSATITSGGTMSSAGAIRVGGFGVNGALTISDGGVVSAVTNINLGAAGTVGGVFEAGNGSIEIDAGGTLLVTGTADLSVAGVLLGGPQGASGTLNVSGAGALLNSGSNLINVGSSGTGTLSVADGATVVASSPGAGDAAIVLGNNATGIGTLDVSGVGSSVTADGALTAGFMGQGSLIVSGGAVVSAEAIFLSVDGGSSGSATVSDGGTLASGGTLAVGGSASNGTLTITDGSVVASNVGLGIGGSVTLDGGTLFSVGTIAVAGGGLITGSGIVDGLVTAPGSITASGGTLTLAQAVSGAGQLAIGAGSDLVLDGGVANTAMVNFTAATGERLDILSPGSFDATVGNFGTGDAIYAQGAASVSTNGSATITLLNTDDQQIGTIDTLLGIAPGALVDHDGLISYACFAAGTRIATAAGEILVESLASGDTVMTASGTSAIVRWIGHRRVACDRHPRPADVWPVRISPGAFGAGRPVRDLWLSPDHAVFAAGRLVPVRYLVNGRTVVQEPRPSVTYFHVELARHDILLAEGLPCESYLDTGNRGAFANGGGAVQMQPEFARRVWAAQGCAKLVLDGPELVAVRRDLLRRACALGHATTDDPELRLLVDGRAIAAVRDGGRIGIRLAAAARTVQVVSRAWIPAHMTADGNDTRTLGVAVGRLWLDGREVSLGSPGLRAGWHAAEEKWRWTDGDAELAVAGARELTCELAMTGTYWQDQRLAGARMAG